MNHTSSIGNFFSVEGDAPVYYPIQKRPSGLTLNSCAAQMPSIPLANFRTVPMKFNGHKINVSGMRHPDTQGGLKMEEVLAEVRKSHDVLISLEGRKDNGKAVREIWEKYKGTYHYCPVVDFTPATLSQMVNVQRIVTDAAKKKQSVVIHCGEGWGRSGTALSALMLTSLSEKSGDKKNLSRTETLKTSEHYDGGKIVPTTPLVAKAVRKVREYDTQVDRRNAKTSDGHSLEKSEQIGCLEDFQILQIKARL